MLKIKITLSKGLKWSNKRNIGNLKISNTSLTMGHLLFKIKSLLGVINSDNSIFLFINNQVLVCNSDLLINIHDKYSINGILNITIMIENTFG